MNTNKNWRIGDAGFTVFGPPNGKPAPEVIATGTNRENIRLCAAAPELLAALEGILNVYYNPGGAEYKAVIAAIAKAKGE